MLSLVEKPRQMLPYETAFSGSSFEKVVCCVMKEKSPLVNIYKWKGINAQIPITNLSNPLLIVHPSVSEALTTLQSRAGNQRGGSPRCLGGVHVGPVQPLPPGFS